MEIIENYYIFRNNISKNKNPSFQIFFNDICNGNLNVFLSKMNCKTISDIYCDIKFVQKFKPTIYSKYFNYFG
jgi:hypothetical protein